MSEKCVNFEYIKITDGNEKVNVQIDRLENIDKSHLVITIVSLIL